MKLNDIFFFKSLKRYFIIYQFEQIVILEND